ncbi:pimeloyl-ACP methyl ester carboxylesterase [Pararhizobium capsulatum DSM 1112]|uniref:Pimeloyl-ACP methyl ester carboxylesterase n=1 Tax=Pararhizobium capsulatum DSM 1112 TaxID=1121113 RepID=A0ABU0BV04_9HYPH|nr:pimeloyl-ACP methyl ester carboxylesterase [Pararhizobium capsulatum DSM 1112]
MKQMLFAMAALLVLGGEARAEAFVFPSSFRTEEIKTNGTTIHVRVGGKGPAVLLVHGYGDTGDMWAPLAAELMADHTVIAPDLRGIGLSAVATDGFTKINQAEDLAGVLDTLKVRQADVVGHDIGNMVAFAFAEAHPDRTTRLIMMDAPLPGVGPWDDILKSPLLWHFRFGGPDMERLVAGRERIYLDRFWNEFAANPTSFPEATRRHYADLYAKPGRMHAGFLQFAAFDQDVIDNRASIARGRLQMPVLAIGGDHSLGSTMAHIMRFAADNVHQVVIVNSGHWLMEEQPDATVATIRAFLGNTNPVLLKPTRLNADEVAALSHDRAGAGTSQLKGVGMIVLSGNPLEPGPYAIELRVPAHTRIASHTHRDNRTALVVSGEWHFGYGPKASDAATLVLGPGGFYTEPANSAHFAFTRNQPTVIYITGEGPTDTQYVDAADAPSGQ